MLQQRTQIYLEPAQHAALIREAQRLGLSLAGIIRKLVDEHLLEQQAATNVSERKAAALSLIGLGKSGVSDVSERTDEYLAQALGTQLVREPRPTYKRGRKPR